MTDSFRRVLAVTAVLTAVFVASVFDTGGLDRDHLARDVGLIALNTLPLLALGWNPLVPVFVLCVAYPVWLSTGHDSSILQSLPMLAAIYVVGAWDRPLWIRALALIAPVWLAAAAISGWWDADTVEVGYVALIFFVVWGLGAAIAARRAYAGELEAKTAALEQARRELADRAVAEERGRIARELHDVIAHAMSVITVRAGVGAHLATAHPAEAAEALRVIERTGREALEEMRRMLAVLREPDARGPRPEPQPGLAEVPRLIEHVGAAGVPVTMTTEGAAAGPLPAGLDLAAYRVIQEALTNVVKHAPGARATLAIRHRPDGVEVEVRSAGRGPAGGPGDEPVPGQGLRGMAERVALYDGRFEAGWVDGGFRVSARFPLDAPQPTRADA
jgi:signal transduction histidine kinase